MHAGPRSSSSAGGVQGFFMREEGESLAVLLRKHSVAVRDEQLGVGNWDALVSQPTYLLPDLPDGLHILDVTAQDLGNRRAKDIMRDLENNIIPKIRRNGRRDDGTSSRPDSEAHELHLPRYTHRAAKAPNPGTVDVPTPWTTLTAAKEWEAEHGMGMSPREQTVADRLFRGVTVSEPKGRGRRGGPAPPTSGRSKWGGGRSSGGGGSGTGRGTAGGRGRKLVKKTVATRTTPLAERIEMFRDKQKKEREEKVEKRIRKLKLEKMKAVGKARAQQQQQEAQLQLAQARAQAQSQSQPQS